MSNMIELAAGKAKARIALRGAELKSWTIQGAELIWPGDALVWADSAPILFPIVGWTRDGIRVEGKSFPLGLHGFARHCDFTLVSHEGGRARLRLDANQATRALYPFEFRFEVDFWLRDQALTIELLVENNGDGDLPFACGLHPGFVWPLPGAKGAHVVRFEQEENPKIPLIAPGGLFSKDTRPIPLHGRELKLTPELFEEALCFLNARSRSLEFSAPGGALLRMELENFPHIALWSLPGEKFLCLEAWTGYGDPENFDGDLFAKPSMRRLKPGETARSAATWTFAAG